MRRWGPVRAPMLGLVLVFVFLGLVGIGSVPFGWAQEGSAKTSTALTLWERLQEPLSPWATAVFVWLVLFVVMAFLVGLAGLTRPRRP